MINWKKIAEWDLREYRTRKDAIHNLEDQIAEIDERMTSLRGHKYDKVPTKGDATAYEEALLDAIVNKERLEENLQAVKRRMEMIERGLDSLGDEDKKMIGYFFLGGGGYIRAQYELNMSQSDIYRRKDRALREFTVRMYGVTEL